MRKMIFVAALVIGSAATASAGQPSGHGGGSYGGGSYVGGYGNYSNPHSTGNSYTAHADSHDGGVNIHSTHRAATMGSASIHQITITETIIAKGKM